MQSVSAKPSAGSLGPYRLISLIHTSPVGRLWLASHDVSGQQVALKTLHEQYHKDREKVGYLKCEYAVGSKLNHPHVVRTYEFGLDKGAPYLALEWFAAPNLKQRIQQGADRIAHLVARIVVEAAEAMAYFDGQGWVHRDVKPENFLVRDDGELKLIDFGLAQRRRRGLARLFAPKGRIQGTHSYMSPEQIRGLALDDRADLYSLACTFYELVSGKPPFTGSSPKDLLNKHLKANPTPLDVVNKNVTSEFADLIRRAMAKEPSQRPDSLQGFLRCLQAIRVFRRTPSPPQSPGKPQAGQAEPPSGHKG